MGYPGFLNEKQRDHRVYVRIQLFGVTLLQVNGEGILWAHSGQNIFSRTTA